MRIPIYTTNKVRLGIGLFHLSNGGLSEREPAAYLHYLLEIARSKIQAEKGCVYSYESLI
jgi:hypothetical protein